MDRTAYKAFVLGNYLGAKKELDKIAKEYHLQVRVIRKEDHKPIRGSKLEALSSIFFLLASVLFLSGNLTGNVISGLNQNSSNWIGGVLFVMGIVGVFAYFKRR